MSPKGIPADVMALTVPVAFAATAFTAWVYRLIKVDPEASYGITEETQANADKGAYYRNQIKSHFANTDISVFNNK
eukprot:CAMPEP_0175065620 /NCGR_PEP_ID=MMETSP0052_2-20121109/16036_1 /TAXON_ID=51329 ORGANISM="Polytomella parva, Strain SAG 63-3" /NCGR_SAMPLE_ID=MMETSP0052_2 /ASSEMBLY_ACC=CAM_ASM_000194 /LENGTH=75 /DNA_ID=CAMNT_0016332195 /DNA_START=33 /DNA_END=260 /DNA_ORIENTATION=+